MNKNRLFYFGTLLLMFILTAGCSSTGKTSVSPTTAGSPSIECELICDITMDDENFKVSCESGEGTLEAGSAAEMEQVYQGGVIAFSSLVLDHTLTYASSNNSYKITGKIERDNQAGNVSYDVQATGGLFGDEIKTCKAGELIGIE